MKKLTLIVLILMLMTAVLPTIVNAQDPTDAGTDAGQTDVATDAGADAGQTDTAADAGTDTGADTDAGQTDAGTTDGGTTDVAADAGTDGAVDDGGEPAQDDGGEPEPETNVIEETVHGKTVVQDGNTYVVTITEESINAFFGGVVPQAVQAIYLDLQNGQIVTTATVMTTRKGAQQFGGTLLPQWSSSNLTWQLTGVTSTTGRVPAELNRAAQNQFTGYLLQAGLADLQKLPQGAKFVSMQLVDGAIVITFTV